MEMFGDKFLLCVGVGMVVVDSIVYIFVGRNKDYEELNEFYVFDIINGVWKLFLFGFESLFYRLVCVFFIFYRLMLF